MSDDKSISVVNLGELSKPAETLQMGSPIKGCVKR